MQYLLVRTLKSVLEVTINVEVRGQASLVELDRLIQERHSGSGWDKRTVVINNYYETLAAWQAKSIEYNVLK